MKTDLKLFREFVRQRKLMGLPLIDDKSLSKAERDIIKEFKAGKNKGVMFFDELEVDND